MVYSRNKVGLIDWFRLEEIVIKKSHQTGYLPANYQDLVYRYVCRLMNTGKLYPYVTRVSYRKNNYYSNKNIIIKNKESIAFENYIEKHQLVKVFVDEIVLQLKCFENIIKFETTDEFLKMFLPSKKIDVNNIKRILTLPQPPYFPKQTKKFKFIKIKSLTNLCAYIVIWFAHQIYKLFIFRKSDNSATSSAQPRKFLKVKYSLRYIMMTMFRRMLIAGLSNLEKSNRKFIDYFREILLSSLRTVFNKNFLNSLTDTPQYYNLEEKSIRKGEKFASFIHLYGRIYLGLGYNNAFDLLLVAAKWKYRSYNNLYLIGVAAQSEGLFSEAELAYKASLNFEQHSEPDILNNLAHVLLAIGKENEAVRYLERVIRLFPYYSMPHQNLAAQYDRKKYNPQMLDLLCCKHNILYDAYNFIGERAIHIGLGKKGVHFYGKAIHQQIQQSDIAKLPSEILRKLESNYLLNQNKPIRILPYEWVTLIGHIAMLDSYIKIQRLGMAKSDAQILLLAPKNKVANHSYLSLWRSHVKIIEDPFLIDALFPYQRYVGDCFNGYLRSDGTSADWTELGAKAQIAWDKENNDALITVPKELHERGWDVLKKLGLKKSDWFVCVHIRGGGYHKENKYSIQTHRDSSISDYLGAIQAITSRGGWVIRMGDNSMNRLPRLERVIDYPHSKYKSQWMDIFLAGTARFFIGTTSGLSNAVISLGTPSLLVNCISNYFQLWNNKVIFMIKPLWFEPDQRYLAINEMVSESFRWNIFNKNKLMSKGVYPECNTPDEITDATLEIMSKLRGRSGFAETLADKILRAECSLGGNADYFGNGRISEQFFNRRQNELVNTI